MFDSLTQGLTGALKNVFAKKLTQDNIADALKEIRTALLGADVHFKVAKELVAKVEEDCIGQKVLEGVDPSQQIVKIVNDRITEVLGGETVEIAETRPLKILLCGLQGAGKTTAAAKLAVLLKKMGLTPLLVACDLQRPAAIEQLRILSEQVGADFFKLEGESDPVKVAKAAMKEYPQATAYIFDTAGRLQIDEALMGELQKVSNAVTPTEAFLVVDSALGQQAVNVAESFRNIVPLTGLILSKLDGDARGGAALSIRTLTGLPIRYISTGEKPEDFELFHPDRMAGRILGMGDVVSLVEKAQEVVDQKDAEAMAKKMMSNEFSMEDLLAQFQQMKKLGDMNKLLKMVPGMSGVNVGSEEQRKMARSEAMILSMTPHERRNPHLVKGSRLNRIAQGSGVMLKDVNALLKQFNQMKGMMKMMKGGKGKGLAQKFMSGAGANNFQA